MEIKTHPKENNSTHAETLNQAKDDPGKQQAGTIPPTYNPT